MRATLSFTGHDGGGVPVEVPRLVVAAGRASALRRARRREPAAGRAGRGALRPRPRPRAGPAVRRRPVWLLAALPPAGPRRAPARRRRSREAVPRRRRRPAARLALRADPRAAVDPGHRAPGRSGRRGEPGPRVPPVVPGAAHRDGQGRAVHARARRRHRRQAAPPGRAGLAAARRDLPRAAHVPRDRRGRARRARRPARPGRARRRSRASASRRSASASTPMRWREVWALREIAFPHRGMPRAGPVSYLNLLHKKRATLAFLHAHHEDLKAAIALAGPEPAQRDRRRGSVCSGTRSGRCCGRRRTRSPSSATCPRPARQLRALAPARAARAGRARAVGADRPLRRPGRPVRVGLQPVPRLDEPRGGVGAAGGAHGLVGPGVHPAPGQPPGGADERPGARGGAPAARRLRREPRRDRGARRDRAAARRRRGAAGGDPDLRDARAATSCGRLAALGPAAAARADRALRDPGHGGTSLFVVADGEVEVVLRPGRRARPARGGHGPRSGGRGDVAAHRRAAAARPSARSTARSSTRSDATSTSRCCWRIATGSTSWRP